MHLIDAVEIARYLGRPLSTKPVGGMAPVINDVRDRAAPTVASVVNAA